MAEATSPLTTGQGRALQVLGHLFLRMGQFQRARKLALALLALDPADLWARRCLAVAWLELGDPERALEQLDLLPGCRAASAQGPCPVAGSTP